MTPQPAPSSKSCPRLPDAAIPSTRTRIRLAYRLTPQRILGGERRGPSNSPARQPRHRDAGRGSGPDLDRLPRCADSGPAVRRRVRRGAQPGGASGRRRRRPVPRRLRRRLDKRGPTGFIGTNKSCAMQTVAAIADDFNAGLLGDPRSGPGRWPNWCARAATRPGGLPWGGRDRRGGDRPRSGGGAWPRVKFTAVPDMVAAARSSRASRRKRPRHAVV